MRSLEDMIAKTDAQDIESVLKAVLARYRVLFPDWTVYTFSVRDSPSLNEQLDQMIRMLENLKTSP